MDSILSKILKKDLFYDYAHPSSLILDTHLMPWRILAKVYSVSSHEGFHSSWSPGGKRLALELRENEARLADGKKILWFSRVYRSQSLEKPTPSPSRLTWPFSAWTCSKTQGWANNSGNGLIRASYLTIASSIKWINRFRLEGNRILWSHNSP